MTLVDTSVWVDLFRSGNLRMQKMLEEGSVATHPMIIGELACGSLLRRFATLRLLKRLPSIPQASDAFVFEAIESWGLWSKGIGWIDAHLLTASIISGVPLWTLDKRPSLLA